MPLVAPPRDEEELKGERIPHVVEERCRRGRTAMQKDASLRALCVRFWRGDGYYYLDSKQNLQSQPLTVTPTGGKPPHRIRNKYPFIDNVVASKVSAATQRVPSYEVIQSTSDFEDYTAARLAEKVAVFGYDQWNARRATVKTVTNALVQREGFVWPYFDPNVGPFTEQTNDDGETEWVGRGEIKLLTLNRSEVMWEPGVDFDDSRWIAVERAVPTEEIEQIPGFFGGKLKPDAIAGDTTTAKTPSDNMALLTDYLERPCPEYPRGRWYRVANGKVIAPREDYPVLDHNDQVLDEPLLHRLSYTVDPDGDDRGLVELLIDLQRTIQDCWNKLLEWKNRCLNPQWSAPHGSQMTRRTDEPGAVFYYNVAQGQAPVQERPAPVPRELFDMLTMAIEHMRALASDVDVQPEPDLAARTATAAIEQARLRWQTFLGDLAEWHSRVMRSCLTLVARHYTEARLIELRGQYSWEAIPNFTGQDLRSQVNVRVNPAMLESHGRGRMLEDLQFMQAAYPGKIVAEAAWSALRGGNGEGLLKSYENHVARAEYIKTELRKGEHSVLGQGERLDMDMGEPEFGFMVPLWMPRPQDNVVIHRQVIGDYMTSPDFDAQTPEVQSFFYDYLKALDFVEQRKAMELAMQEQGAAEQLGLQNASAPQAPSPAPQARALTPEQAGP